MLSARHILYVTLFAMAVGIQWPLWFGKGGIARMHSLERELQSIRDANDRLRAENDAVAAEIESLESGSGAVEERARMRLGMIRNDEVLFRFIARTPKSADELQALDDKILRPDGGKPQIFAPKRSDLYIDGAPDTPAKPK